MKQMRIPEKSTSALEKQVTKQVLAYLDTLLFCKATKISDRFQKGISDILVCYKGRFVAIELKRTGGKTTPHQEKFIQAILDSGGVAGVCYSVDDVKQLLVGL